MTKVHVGNFHLLYPKIKEEIQNNTFISIDCEFSGWDANKPLSLFDTPSGRYLNEKNNLKGFLIVQLGLGIFTLDSKDNKFHVSCYTFPMLPVSHHAPSFRCNASAVQFLTSVGFDWNGLARESLPYVPRSERPLFITNLRNGRFLEKSTHFLDMNIEKDIENILGRVRKMVLEDFSDIFVNNEMFRDPCMVYLCLHLVRREFDHVWVERETASRIRIFRIPKESIEDYKLRETPENVLDDYFMGVCHVFEDICGSRNPVVGHNLMKDLIMLYQQFIGPLPSTYKQYKNEICTLFPNLYDTKLLGYKLKNKMPLNINMDYRSLQEFYNFMTDKDIKMNRPYGPTFSDPPQTTTFHDAGFDAYCTGYCFVGVAYFFSILKDGEFKFPNGPRPWGRLLSCISEYKNCVNMTRAQTRYIKFDGEDPVCNGQILHVRSNTNLDHNQLSELCGVFCSVDVITLSAREALLSVCSTRMMHSICENLRQNGYKVNYGVPWKYKYPLVKITAVSAVAILLIATLRCLHLNR